LNNELTFLGAFLIGLFGSLHCMGMCGPIVFALPISNGSRVKFILGRLLYNLGRIITYSFLGAVFGLLGSRIYMFGLQQVTSIILGILILIVVLTPAKQKSKFMEIGIIKSINNKLKLTFSKYLKSDSLIALLIIGLLNGFLPCGLVYVAIAGAIGMGNLKDGVIFMMLFGFGTFPLLFAVSFLTSMISTNSRMKIKKLIPILSVLLALIFILRGMNLGIKYVSPKLKMQSQKSSLLNHQKLDSTKKACEHNCCGE
jgi:hypothetical protein